MKVARGDGRAAAHPAANDAEQLPAGDAADVDLRPIPYAFARRHGFVVSGARDGQPEIAMREGADPQALIELRRFLGRPFALHKVDAASFDRLLSDLYASGADAAVDAAGSLGFDDLGHLASALPTADDLLDTSDDAPAIRLINGIIADAARQGVSDIHIEP